VLYIAGSGRSGSTLLTNVLGEADGLVNVGELRFIWERGFAEDRLCGCGTSFSNCPFWSRVIDKAFGSKSGVDPEKAIEAQRSQTQVRHLPRLLKAALTGERYRLPADHEARLTDLYSAIAAETGAAVIVDSSKLPSYGYMLERVPGLELYVLHLTRDPRAAAYSWLRKKPLHDRPTPSYMLRQGPVHSSVLWTIWNGVTPIFWRKAGTRYMHVRYEDFVADPNGIVQRVLGMVGAPDGAPLVDDHGVELHPNHTVAGNPDRLRNGRVTIREDDEWKRSITLRTRIVVSLIGLPFLKRFGYPVFKGM
jgi:hypothetical protein